jgi:hypothetical protein
MGEFLNITNTMLPMSMNNSDNTNAMVVTINLSVSLSSTILGRYSNYFADREEVGAKRIEGFFKKKGD